jgi:TRAP-type uncharacterized transport system substrate-binding protein
MSYYTHFDDCHQDIIDSLNEKIDRTKINNKNYITTFINDNLINEINTTIYNKLLSFTPDENQKFIENCKNFYYGYNIVGCIHLYKKYYKDDEEFNELLMDSENYFKYSEDLLYNYTKKYYSNEKELKFFAKLALVIIYDDIINNEKELKFFAKLALVIIYDDIINNEKKLNNLKKYIK